MGLKIDFNYTKRLYFYTHNSLSTLDYRAGIFEYCVGGKARSLIDSTDEMSRSWKKSIRKYINHDNLRSAIMQVRTYIQHYRAKDLTRASEAPDLAKGIIFD